MAFSFFVTKLAPTSAVFSVNSRAYRVAKSGMFTGRYLSAYLRLKKVPPLGLWTYDCCYHDENRQTRNCPGWYAPGNFPGSRFSESY